MPIGILRRGATWIYGLVGIIGVLITFYPTLFSGFARLQADLEDTRLNNYFLEHSFQLLVNRHYNGGLWSPTFFYPAENVLAYSDNLFGAAPIYWLFRTVCPPDLAFQLWAIATALLTYAACAWLLRSCQVSAPLSALGGFWFAFGLPRTAQLGHPQLLPQFFTPLALLVAWQWLRQPTRRRLVLLLLLLYLQTLAAVYLGWFVLVSLPGFAIAACLLHRPLRQTLRSYLVTHWLGDGLILLVWLGAMLATFYPYLQVARAMGTRPYLFIDLMLPRWQSWFSVAPGSLWAPLLAWSQSELPRAVRGEHYLFVGGMLWLFTGLTLYLLLQQPARFSQPQVQLITTCLVVAAGSVLVSLRLPAAVSTLWQMLAPYYPVTLVATAFPYNLSLWSLIYFWVPAASAIRAVTRIWTVVYLYSIVAVTLGAEVWFRNFVAPRWRTGLLVCVLGLGMGEQWVLAPPSYEKAVYLQEEAELQTLMASGCDVAYVTPDLQRSPQRDTGIATPCPLFLSAMWAGLKAQVPVVNGCSGNAPPGYGSLSKSPEAVLQWLGEAPGERLCLIYPRSLTPTLPTAQQQTLRTTPNFFAVTLQRPRRELPKLPGNFPNQP